MSKKIVSVAVLLALSSFSLTSCEQGNYRGGSKLVGGATGLLIGSQFGGGSGKIVAAGLGALIGTYVGDQIGQRLNERDRNMLYSSSNQAFDSGRATSWNNPNTGNYGTVTPVRTVQQQGTVCREYQQDITVGGKKVQGYGTACRQADGSWQIVK